MKCLAPCPACERHVAIDETACPFCAAVLPDSFRQEHACRRAPPGRLSRAALVAAGATLMSVSCSTAAAYGIAIPWDAGANTSDASNSDDAQDGANATQLAESPPADSERAEPKKTPPR